MSVSKWKWTEMCDSKPCCGDCDECSEEDEEMTDITYCTKLFCKNTECERHFDNIAEVEYGSRISFAEFTECEFWESEEV